MKDTERTSIGWKRSWGAETVPGFVNNRTREVMLEFVATTGTAPGNANFTYRAVMLDADSSHPFVEDGA